VPEASVRAAFLDALSRLHERFLVDIDGVTEVWLIRHADAYGELVTNDYPAAAVAGDQGFLSGEAGDGTPPRIDPPLSPRGRQQAALLGRRLAASGVGAVWSSNLLRAQQTASLAAAPGGLRTEIDDRLREVKTHWDAAEPGANAPEVLDTLSIPFVEPPDEVVARMEAAVRDIAADAGPGGRVAAVSHAGAISMYVAHLLKLDAGPLRLLPQFTSVSVVALKDDRVVVHSIGDTGHLVRERSDG
jgi:probable phosphoglycerate mutase